MTRSTVGVCVVLVSGCNLLLDTNGYHLSELTADGGGDGGLGVCRDPSGFSGLGCWACAPTTREQYLNQCSPSTCLPFDRSRLVGLLADGGVPALPTPDAGVDAGMPDAGASDPGDDAGTADAGAVDAGTGCTSLPNPLVVVGSSAMKPFLARLAARLGNAGAPITIVYQSLGSCLGVSAVVQNVPAKGTATWWDPAAPEITNERTCALPSTGVAVDLGMSDVFPSSCGGLPLGLPANVGDFFGPIQTMALVVPAASTQHTITGEAAYLAYGLGSRSGLAPWTDEAVLFQRNASSGTQSLIASVIQVPPAQWRGTPTKNSDDMVARLLNVPADKAEQALGILSTDYTDAYRAELRVLAYQDFAQGCAFFPDSTATSYDKANVRSGQYPLWGPVHFLVRVNATTGGIVSPNAETVVGYLNGSRQLPGVDLVQYYALRRLVPSCAMKVTRASDGAAPTAFTPTKPCGCYFEAQVTGQTSCTRCTTALDCSNEAPNCSFGYCEK
jgi:ABC-type phosphate transport system substrate-binding protein